MFGIRKRREEEKMRRIQEYEYVKNSIVNEIFRLSGEDNKVYIDKCNMYYSIYYVKETKEPYDIASSPFRKSLDEIKYVNESFTRGMTQPPVFIPTICECQVYGIRYHRCDKCGRYRRR